MTKELLKTVLDSRLQQSVDRHGRVPGERWTYGVNLDWLGRIIERLREKRLGAVMQERLFAPLGMSDIGFTLSESMKARRAVLHDRPADGRLTPLPDLVLPQPPEMDCGGHGRYASVGEYMKFIRMMLNGGGARSIWIALLEYVCKCMTEMSEAVQSGPLGRHLEETIGIHLLT